MKTDLFVANGLSFQEWQRKFEEGERLNKPRQIVHADFDIYTKDWLPPSKDQLYLKF